MAKEYYLRFLIRNQADDLFFGVREEEVRRLEGVLDDNATPSDETRFFWLRTIDGRSVAINLEDVQAVRFLWEPAVLPPDTKRYDGPISICLRGRPSPLDEHTESPDQLYDLFRDLEFGSDTVAFPKFDDVDGEPLQLNAREIVWIIAPTDLLDEGARIINEEDGFTEDT